MNMLQYQFIFHHLFIVYQRFLILFKKNWFLKNVLLYKTYSPYDDLLWKIVKTNPKNI